MREAACNRFMESSRAFVNETAPGSSRLSNPIKRLLRGSALERSSTLREPAAEAQEVVDANRQASLMSDVRTGSEADLRELRRAQLLRSCAILLLFVVRVFFGATALIPLVVWIQLV